MKTAYRAAPEGPFSLSVRYDAEVRKVARRAVGPVSVSVLVPLGVVISILTALVSPAPFRHPIAFVLALSVHVGAAWIFGQAWWKARQASRPDEDMAITIDEAGVRFEGADGAWTQWAWPHVARAERRKGLLVILSRTAQVVAVTPAAYSDLESVERYVNARARPPGLTQLRVLALATGLHALLASVAVGLVAASAAATPPAPRPADERATRAVDLVTAALTSGREPTPAELGGAVDACDRMELALFLDDAARAELAPAVGPLEAARAHFTLSGGSCDDASSVVLARVEADDPVLGRVAYFALTNESNVGSWALVGPEPIAPAPLRTRPEDAPEWIVAPLTGDTLIERAVDRHRLLLGRSPLGEPTLVEAP